MVLAQLSSRIVINSRFLRRQGTGKLVKNLSTSIKNLCSDATTKIPLSEPLPGEMFDPRDLLHHNSVLRVSKAGIRFCWSR